MSAEALLVTLWTSSFFCCVYTLRKALNKVLKTLSVAAPALTACDDIFSLEHARRPLSDHYAYSKPFQVNHQSLFENLYYKVLQLNVILHIDVRVGGLVSGSDLGFRETCRLSGSTVKLIDWLPYF